MYVIPEDFNLRQHRCENLKSLVSCVNVVISLLNEVVRNVDGRILIGQKRRTWRKTCPDTIMSTKIRAWSGLQSNPALCCKRQAISRLRHGAALEGLSKDTGSCPSPSVTKGSVFFLAEGASQL
jgi:hypothetical protein